MKPITYEITETYLCGTFSCGGTAFLSNWHYKDFENKIAGTVVYCYSESSGKHIASFKVKEGFVQTLKIQAKIGNTKNA